jgi:uncharacterized protein (TIGR03437 family)
MSRWIIALSLAASTAAWGQTFGRVVAIGGLSSDLALDESRRVLYVANFTANRIEVISLESGALERSMNVPAQPSSLSMSPDGHWLLVGHYANFATPNTPRNALTLIDLGTGSRQTFALADPPYGVGFGADNRALVVTSTQFLLFEPNQGTMQVLDSIAGVTAKTLPQAPPNAPTQIVGASVSPSGDRMSVFGITDTILFNYDVMTRMVRSRGYVASPPLGPRAISVAKDGSYYAAGWGLWDDRGLVAQFPNPEGALNIGSHAIDSERRIIYAQIPEQVQQTQSTQPGGTTPQTPAQPSPAETKVPFLMVVDADNLTVREKVLLPENLAGKGILTSDGQTMFALSESGVMILPVGTMDQVPRVLAQTPDLVFRSTFCDRRVLTQDLTIVDSAGGNVDFTLSTTQSGLRFSRSGGRTPMTVKVSLDPAAFSNLRGTLSAKIDIKSAAAVNVIQPVRVLINLQEPDQRGTFVNVAGKLIDVLSDPFRNRFFVLRQNTNEVLIFDGATYQQTGSLRTGNTPMAMAFTFDRRYLLVGNDNSQIANVYDLETLEAQTPIRFPFGHYPRYLAASGRAILAATRVAGPVHKIDRVDFMTRTAAELPTLGVFENKVDVNTALIASPNGSTILAASKDGTLLLYNANADTFTVGRKEAAELEGALAASSFDQYVIGNALYNASLVATRRFDNATGRSSGFLFVDQYGLRTGSPADDNPGVIQKVDLATGVGQRATRMVESPVLNTSLPGTIFTRTVAILPDRSAIINLSTSGFTVLAWNYDAAVAMPRIDQVVNAADGSRGVAPGGLIVIRGRDLSPVNIATREIPLPTALGESCLTVNGLPVPMIFVSSSLINAQLPYQAEGNVTMILRTPGGVSDNYNLVVLPAAPSVFRNTDTESALVIRAANNTITTPSNPVRGGDDLTIYLTGMGRTTPSVADGMPGPGDPLANALITPQVFLAGVELPVAYAGLAPGQVGVNQINVQVPHWVPRGLNQELRIEQGGSSTSVQVRVVD